MKFDDQQRAGAAMEGHLATVKDDLRHANELLLDAVSNLLTNALAISNACLKQQQVVLCDEDLRQKEQLLALNREIDARSNDLIVNLQFQDMVTQLLERVLATIDSLENSRSLTADDAGGKQCFHSTQMNSSERDAELCSLAQGARGKPVMSRDMQSGEVELF